MMKLSVISPSLRSVGRLAAAFTAALSFATLHAQDWLVVDTFDNGAPQAEWVSTGGLISDFSDDQLRIRTATGSSESIYTPLPQTTTSGKVTVFFDMRAPAGDVSNEFGFGVAGETQIVLGSWGRVGLNNRFQMANAFPQTLVRAGQWGTDLLNPTLFNQWYNIWIVYNLDASPVTFDFYYRLSNAESTEPRHGGTFTDGDGLNEVRYLVLGVGGLNPTPDGRNADESLGGQFDNIYMAVGENLTLPPTARVELPPAWQVVDLFPGAPMGTWSGDLDFLDLDFSEGYLAVKPKSGQRRSNMYVELPETVIGGRFTVTFDLFVEGASNERTDLAFAVVGDSQISLSGTDQLGGNDRIGTFGTAPQVLRSAGIASDVLIAGTEVQGQWRHFWMYYNVTQRTLTVFHSLFGEEPDWDAPNGVYSLGGTYENFRYFILGFDRDTSVGMRVGNLYFASDELLTLSPTAGTFDTDEPIVLPEFGWSVDAQLGSIYHYEESPGWVAFFGHLEVPMGYLYVGERSVDSAGWVYFYPANREAGQWVFIAGAGNLSAEDGSLYLYLSDRDDWAIVSAEFGFTYYLVEAAGWFSWLPF